MRLSLNIFPAISTIPQPCSEKESQGCFVLDGRTAVALRCADFDGVSDWGDAVRARRFAYGMNMTATTLLEY